MKIFVEKTFEEMSLKASNDLIQELSKTKAPLLCVPSGDSPVAVYKQLVSAEQKGIIQTSNWNFISLDEWMGMNDSDEGSCTYYLTRQLLHPLQADPQRVFLFDGKADAESQCRHMENFISERGGIDVAILGLGLNGHIGMNEPGTPATTRTHISNIDRLTQQVGQKYFKQPTQLSQGLTLGLATLLEAKHIMPLVSGARKAEVVKQILEGPVTESIPASLLQRHPNTAVYLDQEAAHLLQYNEDRL